MTSVLDVYEKEETPVVGDIPDNSEDDEVEELKTIQEAENRQMRPNSSCFRWLLVSDRFSRVIFTLHT